MTSPPPSPADRTAATRLVLPFPAIIRFKNIAHDSALDGVAMVVFTQNCWIFA
jgi:hypothetical protein